MTASNLYATIAELKAWNVARGITPTSDTSDDAVLSALIEQVSRYVDGPSGANTFFYPSYETRLYDVPNSRDLKIDGPLLAITTFLNGDGSTITSDQYRLHNPNKTPYWKVSLRDTATITWYLSSGSAEQVLSIAGWWGHRKQYAVRGWTLAGTLGAAITDTTTKAFTMSSGHTLAVGQIIKIDSEIYNIATVSTNTITPNQRGDNGSTAATHSNGASVYIWNVQEEIKLAVLETALGVNAMRNGQANSGKISITAAGVVIRPEEVPPMAQKIFDAYRSPL